MSRYRRRASDGYLRVALDVSLGRLPGRLNCLVVFRNPHRFERKSTRTRVLIRPVATADELDQVYRLHHDSWVHEGHLAALPSGRIIRHPELDVDRNTVILAAFEDGKVVGTNTATLDGPLGVPMDHGLKHELDAIRQEGHKLMASWRIATHPSYRNRTSLILQLIAETADWGHRLGGSACVYLFAKRHERVYQRLVSARTICDAGFFYPDAPRWHATLMRTDAASLGPDGFRNLADRLRAKALAPVE